MVTGFLFRPAALPYSELGFSSLPTGKGGCNSGLIEFVHLGCRQVAPVLDSDSSRERE